MENLREVQQRMMDNLLFASLNIQFCLQIYLCLKFPLSKLGREGGCGKLERSATKDFGCNQPFFSF